jgi:hypothetical protein
MNAIKQIAALGDGQCILVQGLGRIGSKKPLCGIKWAIKKPPVKEVLWSRQESNLDLKFRKLLFYPLNYGTSNGKSKPYSFSQCGGKIRVFGGIYQVTFAKIRLSVPIGRLTPHSYHTLPSGLSQYPATYQPKQPYFASSNKIPLAH